MSGATLVTSRELELRRQLAVLRFGLQQMWDSMMKAYEEVQARELALFGQLKAARADIERLTRERDDARREHDEEHGARESLEGDLDIALCARTEAEAQSEELRAALDALLRVVKGEETGGAAEVARAVNVAAELLEGVSRG